jgi:hemoglobin-like flavoprotein
MQTLGIAVAGLSRIDELGRTLRELGHKHCDYGVTDADYDTVGAALLWTLEQGLGAAFTAEAGDAWATAYNLLAGTMKAGASVRAAA